MRLERWEEVTLGHSGAVVRRSPDGRHYAKTVTAAADRVELLDERDRLLWLATTPIPAPLVVDCERNKNSFSLVTTALPGVPASSVRPSQAARATRSLAAFLRRLHALDPDTCPFDRSLAVTLPLAAANVATGSVDEDDFDPERSERTAADLLTDLQSSPEAAAPEDIVVCHGDACLPNFHVDPESLEVVGVLDVGRLGRADRYQDLALLTRSMSAGSLNPGYGPAFAAQLLTAYGITAPDHDRLAFYRLLDEFF